MAKEVVVRNTSAIGSAQITASQVSSLIGGVFVGIHTDGKLKLADFRAAQGPVVARGVLMKAAQLKDPKGNVLDAWSYLDYGWEAEIEGFVNLSVGKTYWLSTGGGISVTKPAAVINDIDQKAGYALSATRLRVEIGTEIIHA